MLSISDPWPADLLHNGFAHAAMLSARVLPLWWLLWCQQLWREVLLSGDRNSWTWRKTICVTSGEVIATLMLWRHSATSTIYWDHRVQVTYWKMVKFLKVSFMACTFTCSMCVLYILAAERAKTTIEREIKPSYFICDCTQTASSFWMEQP